MTGFDLLKAIAGGRYPTDTQGRDHDRRTIAQRVNRLRRNHQLAQSKVQSLAQSGGGDAD